MDRPNYLEGLGPAPPPAASARSRSTKTLLLWIALIVMFLTVYQFLRAPEPAASAGRATTATTRVADDPPAIRWMPWEVGALVAGALALFVMRTRSVTLARNREFQRADLERARGDMSAAVTRLRTQLGGRYDARRYAAVVTRLGLCAESAGDFADAAELFARAAPALPTAGGAAALGDEQIALRARHAFALAATGQLDEAQQRLELPAGASPTPQSGAVVVRSRALILARRNEAAALDALLREHAALCEQWLPARDRTLLRALQLATLGDRAGGGLAVGTTEPVSAWIARVHPPAAAFVVAS